MNRLFLFLVFVAVSFGLTAVPYGQFWSAETLSSSSTPSTTPVSSHFEIPEYDEAMQEFQTLSTIDDDVEKTSEPDNVSEMASERPFKMDDHFHNKHGEDWGLYVPIDLSGESTTVRRAAGFGLEKRGADAGTMQMDCLETPEVCKNVGWFQNCLRDARGDHTKVVYINGPLELKVTPVADQNRIESGVKTSWGRPCKVWPFAQRFWHMHPNASSLSQKYDLETDEWPMATMTTPAFVSGRSVPEVSLRCMTGVHNIRGSNQITTFRKCQKHYKAGGKWAHHRNANAAGRCEQLAMGDTYTVDFNFDRFVPWNPNHDFIRE